MGSIKPFSVKLGGATGISAYESKVERCLSNLREYFLDKDLVKEKLLKGEDPIIYEVYENPQKPIEGMFNVGCTVIYPGKIGDEYYFTKGHSHEKESASEIYVGIKGEGLILMQNYEGKTTCLEIKPDVLIYIPPRTAHRSVNTGDSKLVFLTICPSDAGHNYETISTKGFAKLVVENDGKPAVIDNPHYKQQ